MKVAEEYCWAITQAARPSCCGRSGSSVLNSGFQVNSLVCVCVERERERERDRERESWPQVNSVPTCVQFDWRYLLPELNHCANRGLSVNIRTSKLRSCSMVSSLKILRLQFQAVSRNCEKRLLASSCMSVRPHRITRLPLDGFWWNLYLSFFLENLSRKFKFH